MSKEKKRKALKEKKKNSVKKSTESASKKKSATKKISSPKKASSLRKRPSIKQSKSRLNSLSESVLSEDINIDALVNELNRLKTAMDIRGMGYWEWNIESNSVYYSPGWKKLLGFNEEEIQNHPDEWLLRIHPDDILRVKEELSSLLKGAIELFESIHRIRRKNGDYKWVKCKARVTERSPDFVPIHIIGTHTNCQRLIELETSRKNEKELFAHGPTIVWIWKNQQGWPVKHVSKNVEQILGFTSDELTLGNILFTDLVHPEDLERVVREVAEHTTKKVHQFEQMYRIKTKSGAFLWVKDFTTVYYDTVGGISELLGYTIDITDLKNAEEEIRSQHTRYKIMMRASSDAIHILNSKGELIEYNDAFLKLLGYTDEEAKGLSVDMWDMQWSKEELLERLSQVSRGFELSFETVHKRKDGTLRNVEISLSGIEVNGETILLNSARDITERKAEEFRLQESEELFRNMFENHSSVMLLIDAETGNLLEANKSALSFYGYTSEEIKQMHLSQINGLTREQVQERIALILQRNDNHLFLTHTLKSGERREVEIFTTPILYRQKTALFSIIFDITEKRLVEKQNQLLIAAMNRAANSIMICNLAGVIEWVNLSFILLSGYNFNECLGKTFSEVIRIANQPMEENQEFWTPDSSGEIWQGEQRIRRKDGSILYVDITITPIRNNLNEVNNFIAILTDVTESKIVQHEIIKAKEQAVEANKMKSAFLANMSHEIRTPLIGILGYSEILQERLEDPDAIRMVTNINKAGNRLLETLDLVLAISRIEADRFELKMKKTEVVRLIWECSVLFEKIAEKKHLELIFEPHIERLDMLTDERVLVEIVNNLINNAVKYTFSGYVKVIVESMIQEMESYLVIRVIDTGIGIPPESQTLIFEEFRQVSEGINRAFEGTGLGLALTKKFVQKLNGYITVQSEVGKGSEFIVKIPVHQMDIVQQNQTAPEQTITEITTSERRTKPRLLLVENDAISCEVITSYLGDEYICEIANDAQKAIEMLHKIKFDLFLMDINLGIGMNGLQLTEYIRKLPGYKDTPVIAVTAFAMHGDREEFITAGCTDYLSKPFFRESLISLIKKYL